MKMNLSVFRTYPFPSTIETLINKLPGNPFKNVLEKDPMATENQKNKCFRHLKLKRKKKLLQNP